MNYLFHRSHKRSLLLSSLRLLLSSSTAITVPVFSTSFVSSLATCTTMDQSLIPSTHTSSIEIPQLTAVYTDEDYLVINKPFNIRMDGDYPITLEKLMPLSFPIPAITESPTITTTTLDTNSTGINTNSRSSSRLYYHHCHQLDYATSGCLLYAKSSDAAAAATLLFEERKTKKEYLALVYGHIQQIPQRPYYKHNNPGIYPLPSHILPTEPSSSISSITNESTSIETYITELKTNAACRKIGQTMEKRRAQILADNIIPIRPPPIWYDTLRQSFTEITDYPAWLIKMQTTSYGEFKYRARTQRNQLQITKPVDDRSDVWNTNKQEITLPEDIQRWINYNEFLPLVEIMNITDITNYIKIRLSDSTNTISIIHENNWASIIFDICLYLAYRDNIRHRNDRQTKRTRKEFDENNETTMKDNVTMVSNNQSTLSETTNTTSSLSSDTLDHKRAHIDSHTTNNEENTMSSTKQTSSLPIFLIDLPIGEVAADGSDFRMQIMETLIDEENNSTTTKPIVSDNSTSTVPTPGIPRPALTLVRVLQLGYYHNQPITKVLLTPISGRRHQLRLHMQSIGHPIVGDDTYCSMYLKEQLSLPVENRCPNLTNYETILHTENQHIQRMMLHSYTLHLDFPWLISNLPNRSYKSARRWMVKRSNSNMDNNTSSTSNTPIVLSPLHATTSDPFVPLAQYIETLLL